MKKVLILSFAISVVACVLRSVFLSTVPPGVNRDEASIGYTAYSLGSTGKDEYGRTLPISFESFGDWKMPLYIYLEVPIVHFFGMNEATVRIPSVLAGTLGVFFITFLSFALFQSQRIALLSAAVLTLMPWHIHISRVESEANVAVTMSIIALVLFFTALHKKSARLLTGSAILLSLTYYTYHGNHVSTTLLLMGMVLLYWKEIFRIRLWCVSLLTGTVITGIILSLTLFGADRTKLAGISIFGNPTVVHEQLELPRLLYDNPSGYLPRMIYNRTTYAVTTIYTNYLRSYSPEFFFIKGGGNSAHNIEGFGNLHPLEAPLLLVGIAFLLSQIRKKNAQLILWWIAIAGIASAITKDAPHSNRMFMVVPALAITVSLGIDWLITTIRKPRVRSLLVAALVFLYACSLGLYLNQYYVHFARTEASRWGYAYKRLTPILFSKENQKKHVVMTKPETSPYIYLLFYSGYDPKTYQEETKRYPISADGFTDVASFGRFSFRAIDWNVDPNRPNTIIVTDPSEIPHALSSKITHTIKYPDGKNAFAVLDTNAL